jgi:hypothetical protein
VTSYQQFTTDYPEFVTATQGQYATASLLAANMLNVSVWGPSADAGQPLSQIDIASELVTAHFLALAIRRQQVAAQGGVPGISTGVTSSSAWGPVSTSFNTELGANEDGSHWNLTEYGVEFLYMARLVGNQPMAIGPRYPGGVQQFPFVGIAGAFGPYW